MRLVLASASPRRAELLRAAGFEFDTLAVDIDEAVRPGEAPAAYVRRLAAEKSARALALLDGPAKAGHYRTAGESEIVVLGADTAVVVDGDILGKPRDDGEAERMLRRLAGRRHEVLTGVSLRRIEQAVDSVETTAVDFMRVTDDEVAWYVASGEGRDKAGAYAIQGLASRFITRIEGSYANVVGLPVHAVFTLLRFFR